MNDRRIKMNAFGISLGIHLILVITSTQYALPSLLSSDLLKQKKFDVKITREKKFNQPLEKSPQPLAPQSVDTFRFESQDYSGTMESFLEKETRIPEKKELALLQEKEDLARTKDKEETYEVKEPLENKALFREPVKRDLSEDEADILRVSYDDLITGAEQYSRLDQVAEDFVDRMPGFTPELVDERMNITPYAPTGERAKEPSSIRRRMSVGDFEGELAWTLETYEDPKDKEKYFRIRFRVRDDTTTLPTLPKEVVFLADSSLSVEEERLKEFQEGIAHSLRNLNEKDLFNVILFKDRILKFRRDVVPPTPKNIEAALAFMKKISVGEKTDVFDVLETSVKRKPRKNPSYIVLLSDGRPTKGVTHPRQLINKIADINKGRKPIFAFSGGTRTNRYLLDFISYKNRGWAEYSYRTHRISENLSKLYDKIDEPVIMNLRYFISGVDPEETFPHILPDFFRNAEFTLYGKYTTEPVLAMQLLGDVGESTKEFLLEGSLAEADKGGSEIAKNWAYNKIYYLISRLEYKKENKEIFQEINALSQKFKLKTPYLKDILK